MIYLLPEGFPFLPALLCALVASFSRLFQGKARKRILLAGLGLMLGFLWSGCYGLIFRTPAHSLANQVCICTLEVKEFPRETTYGASLVATLQTDKGLNPTVYLYASTEALTLHPGDHISATVKLSRSDLRRGESYDYYQSRGIYLIGNIQGDFTLLEDSSSGSPQYWPQRAAKALKDAIQALFPADLSGFFTALLTGDKSFLPDGLYAAFRRSGVAHIVAVSGLHLSFLSGLFSLLIRRRNGFTIGFQIFILFFFAAMTGNSYSSLRAAFMASTLLIAPLVGRENDPLTALSTALFLLLFLCPYSAASIGLQLSFSALLGIILLTEKLNTRLLSVIPMKKASGLSLLHKARIFLAGTLAASLGAMLFTIPIVAIHYRSVSLVALLTNLLTLWAVSAAFTLGLLAALLWTILPHIGGLLAWCAIWPARWVIIVTQGISRWPFAALSILSGYLILWFVIAYGVILLWLFGNVRVRPWIPGATLFLTLCVALFVQAHPFRAGNLTVTVLDVGQGSATLLYSKGHAVLVDCGGNKDNAGDIAADLLQSLGLSKLDALILTHYDSDHTNGVSELMERLQVPQIFLPDVAAGSESRSQILALCEKHSCNVELLYSEDFNLCFGEAKISIYTPMGNASSNLAGLSVLCTAGEFDLLITGDMDAAIERRLIKYKPLPDIELLVVGHHGSKNACSTELLEHIQPEMAVISVGYNTYGHPADQTLARLVSANCAIYRTDLMGTLTFRVD